MDTQPTATEIITPKPAVSIKTLVGILVLLVLIIAGGFYGLYVFQGPGSRTSVDYNSVYQSLSQNKTFQAAESAFKSGDRVTATKLYTEAASTVTDPNQEAHLKYLAAHENPSVYASIRGYKEIAANESYDKVQRAYAIQSLAVLGWRYASSSVNRQIFSGYPYNTFFDQNARTLSYRRLFEYGTTFYPLAISEYWIADWYATRYQRLSTTKPLTDDDKQTLATLLGIVKDHLSKGDAHVALLQTSDEYFQVDIPEALLSKAGVLATMRLAGDASFEDPKAFYEKVLTLKSYDKTVEVRARLYYSLYLYRLTAGKNVAATIAELLSPIYDNFDQYQNTLRFVGNEKDNHRGMKADLLILASVDPKFKALLTKLGWSANDFK